jgi:hypothetical protein
MLRKYSEEGALRDGYTRKTGLRNAILLDLVARWKLSREGRLPTRRRIGEDRKASSCRLGATEERLIAS